MKPSLALYLTRARPEEAVRSRSVSHTCLLHLHLLLHALRKPLTWTDMLSCAQAPRLMHDVQLSKACYSSPRPWTQVLVFSASVFKPVQLLTLDQ